MFFSYEKTITKNEKEMEENNSIETKKSLTYFFITIIISTVIGFIVDEVWSTEIKILPNIITCGICIGFYFLHVENKSIRVFRNITLISVIILTLINLGVSLYN